MSMSEVVIFGLGDFARLAALYLERDSSYSVSAFTADERYIKGREWLGKPVIAFDQLETLYPPECFSVFVAIGFKGINKARAQVYELCKSKGYKLISYRNSTVVDFGKTRIGDNCFILENTIIQPFASIGNDVIIWGGSHIGHDSIIGDHTFIGPCVAISGNVTVGPYCFIGINATLRDGITIAPGCVIGAGVSILRDTVAESVYANKTIEPKSVAGARLRGF